MRRRSFRTVPLRCSMRCRHCSRRCWTPVRRPRAAELSRGRRAHPRWSGVYRQRSCLRACLGSLTRSVGEEIAMTRPSLRRILGTWGKSPGELPDWKRVGPAKAAEMLGPAITQEADAGLHARGFAPRTILAAGALALTLALGSGLASGAEKLGSYPVDPGKVSISGISSGAFMANQFHIAHSALIMGAAMVARGPYAFALGRLGGGPPRGPR